ncbi:hypothetical protein JYU34_006598 [Plutella xylostella]|uniref:Non-homologous end-joining factor 1 n=1 Tax=Plutella xylostella TaxID=51655 RepID=A0ABQ7QSK1_PLUXY|nr:hypothetical protein JYU34_006598 [Plutella xylostella]
MSKSNRNTMWKAFPHSNFFIKFAKNEFLEIYVTNFISIWSKYLSQEEFLECVKRCNKILEGIEEAELLAEAESMLVFVDTLTKVTVKESAISCGSLDLHLGKVSESGYPINLLLSLTEGTKEMFFQNVTYPLWQSTQDLLASQRQLRHLLVEKNKEIKEYKQEGGKILKCFKTDTFNEEAHLNLHKKYVENFAFTASESIDNLYMNTKKECWSIVKREELSSKNIAAAATSVIVKPEVETDISIGIKMEPEVSSQEVKPIIKPDSSLDNSQESQQNKPNHEMQDMSIKSEHRNTEPRSKRKKLLNL